MKNTSDLEAENQELRLALRVLVEKYVANRGTEHEFVVCITPDGVPIYWRRAIDLLDRIERSR